MANYATLKAAINAVIKANGNKEITGTVLNETLTAMVNSLGANYQFAGVATPSTNPGTPDQNVFYLAGQAGTYTNFNGIVLPDGVSVLMWNGSWSSQAVLIGDGGVFDLSAYNAVGGVLAIYADLSAALTALNALPAAYKRGGMSFKFVQSSDNKYVQYMCKSSTWSITPTDWERINNVSVSQNTNTGGHNLEIGGTKVANVDGFFNINLYNDTISGYGSQFMSAIPNNVKAPGLMVTYLGASGWEYKRYVGPSVADEYWNDNQYWENLKFSTKSLCKFASYNSSTSLINIDIANKKVTFKQGTLFITRPNNNELTEANFRNNTGADLETDFIYSGDFNQSLWYYLFANRTDGKIYLSTFQTETSIADTNIYVLGCGTLLNPKSSFILGGSVLFNNKLLSPTCPIDEIDAEISNILHNLIGEQKVGSIGVTVGQNTENAEVITNILIPAGRVFTLRVESDGGDVSSALIYFNGQRSDNNYRYFTGELPREDTIARNYDITKIGFLSNSEYITTTGNIKLILTLSDTINSDISGIKSDLEGLTQVVENLPVTPEFAFEGKKLSVIGDSISTYAGYIPTGYDAWYPNNMQDVDSVDKMWWKMLCDRTRMVIGTIAAWSGSLVTGNALNTSSALDGCSTKRVNDLSLNGTPDIVICYIGYNDIKNARTLGSYVGNSAYPTETTNMNVFSEAYATMVKKVIQTYPNAIVLCCTILPNTWKNANRASGDPENVGTLFPYTTAGGTTMQEYNERIREIAKNFGVGLIDLARCGITWENKANYTDDISYAVHPSYAGQKMISYKAEQDLINYCKTLELNT